MLSGVLVTVGGCGFVWSLWVVVWGVLFMWCAVCLCTSLYLDVKFIPPTI